MNKKDLSFMIVVMLLLLIGSIAFSIKLLNPYDNTIYCVYNDNGDYKRISHTQLTKIDIRASEVFVDNFYTYEKQENEYRDFLIKFKNNLVICYRQYQEQEMYELYNLTDKTIQSIVYFE